MSPNDSHAVRPTRRALDDIGVPVPSLFELLHESDNPHIKSMQETPKKALVQGLDRIRSLKDRVWFKYKSDNVRGIVTKLSESEVFPSVANYPTLGRWWVGAFGHRQEDSPQKDFYKVLEAEVKRKGKQSGKPTCSDHLLPTGWDEARLHAEMHTVLTRSIKETVVRIIAESMRSGQTVCATAAGHYIQAQVSAPGREEAYLILGAGGIYDHEIVAIILDSVPGVPRDDWMLEPSEALGVNPASGEIVWSAMLSPESQQSVLDMADSL